MILPIIGYIITMNKVGKKPKRYSYAINILDDIENVDLILTEEEVKKINTLFKSIDNFNQITEQMEKVIIKNNVTESDFRILFNSVKKIVAHKVGSNLQKPSEYKRKMGLTQTFFELPEIISKKLSINKSY